MKQRDTVIEPSFASRLKAGLRHGPRLVSISAALVILITWLGVFLYVSEQRQAIFDAARQELRGGILTLASHARRTIEAVNTTLRSVDSWLYEASKNPRYAPLDDLAMIISSIQASNEDYIDIRPITNDGFLFRFNDGGEFRAFVGDRPYFQRLYSERPGTLFIAEPVVSRDSGRYVLPIAMKTRENRYGVGYVVAAVTVKQFEDAYRALLISATGRIGLMRADGTLLMSVPEGKTAETAAAADFLAAVAQIESSEPTIMTVPSPFGDGEAIAAIVHLARQPILVYAAFDVAELEQRWIARAWPNIAAAFVVSLLTLLIAGWLRHLMHLKDIETNHTRKALAEANAANTAKRQFLANMSHELRTPLNAILGFSEVISQAMFGPIDALYRTYGNDIHKSGKHLLHLVDQLLDVSRIESGAMALQIQPCDLKEILHEALRITEPIRARNDVRVSVDLQPGATSLITDRGAIRQILINLLANAAKYNRPGGSITIRSSGSDDAFTLSVEDTGVGISPTALQQVFEPFKRGDAHVAQTTDTGFGLGLPIVKGLVTLLGGEIEVHSEPGKGTLVTVQLPQAAQQATSAG
jgi:signal transduction histidine kinase